MFMFIAGPAGSDGGADADTPPDDPGGPPAAGAAEGRGARGPPVRDARAGRLRACVNRLRAANEAAVAQSCPSLANAVSRTLGFTCSGETSLARKVCEPLGIDAELCVAINKRKQHSSLTDRALTSYVAAVATGMRASLANATLMLLTETSDDASMWMAQPLSCEELREQARRAKAAENLGLKAQRARVPRKTKHVPCLNFTGNVFLEYRGAAGSCPSSAYQVHSPALPLARSNWMTIESRKLPWSVMLCGRVGRVWEERAPGLQEALSEVRIVIKVMTQDAATTNNCLIRREQDAVLSFATVASGIIVGPRLIRALLPIRCLSHQSCLETRPLYESLGDHASFLVRCSHVLANSRTWRQVLTNMNTLVEKKFTFRVVTRLPREAPAWRRRNLALLKACVAAMPGLMDDEVDVETVLEFFNGDWANRNELCHWHIAGDCLCGCGTREEAMDIALGCVHKLLARGMGVPLQYRWKGVEAANAWLLLSLTLANLLYDALKMIWKPKDMHCNHCGSDAGCGCRKCRPIPNAIKIQHRYKTFLQFPVPQIVFRC